MYSKEEVRGLETEILNIQREAKRLRKRLQNAKLKEVETLEVGTWYKDGDKWMGFYDGENFIYGFDTGGCWYNQSDIYTPTKKETKVTPSEVEEALKNEAIKLGMVKGARINHDSIFKGLSKNSQVFTGEYDYCQTNNILYIDGTGIFFKGLWATIIKENTLLEDMQELLNKHK